MTKTSALASAAATARIAAPVPSRLAAACSAGMEACWLAALVVATLFFNTPLTYGRMVLRQHTTIELHHPFLHRKRIRVPPESGV